MLMKRLNFIISMWLAISWTFDLLVSNFLGTMMSMEGFFILRVRRAPMISLTRVMVLVFVPPPPPTRCLESRTYWVMGSETHWAAMMPTDVP